MNLVKSKKEIIKYLTILTEVLFRNFCKQNIYTISFETKNKKTIQEKKSHFRLFQLLISTYRVISLNFPCVNCGFLTYLILPRIFSVISRSASKASWTINFRTCAAGRTSNNWPILHLRTLMHVSTSNLRTHSAFEFRNWIHYI